MLDDGVHRFDQLSVRMQRSAAGTEFVSGEVQAVNIKAVAGQKSAEKIQILLGTGVTVAGDDADAARTARFVIQCGKLRSRARQAQQINLQRSSPATALLRLHNALSSKLERAS